MSKLGLSTLLVLALASGCKEGEVYFFDGGFARDSGAPPPDAGTDAASPEVDASGGEPDTGTDAASPTSDAGSGTTPSVAQLADDLATATCDALTQCAGDEGLVAELLGGRDCVDVNGSELRNGELSGVPDAVEAGRIAFDASELDACLEDIAALGCEVRSQRRPASCELLLLGTVDAGGECGIDQECAGDAFCATDAACPGTCTPLLSADATCAGGDDDQCEDGLVCAAATGTCTELGGSGTDCGAGLPPCTPGLVCFDGDSGAQCTPVAVLYFRALDETCIPGDPSCDAGVSLCGDVELCEPSLVCESASSGGVCRPRTEARAGDCKRAVPSQCPLEQVCDAPAPGETGSCVDRPGAGEPCIDRSPHCGPGNVCVDDSCVELLDNGATCDDAVQCHGGSCSAEGKCEGPAVCAG